MGHKTTTGYFRNKSTKSKQKVPRAEHKWRLGAKVQNCDPESSSLSAPYTQTYLNSSSMVLFGEVPYSFTCMLLEILGVWQYAQLILTCTQPWAEARNNFFPSALTGSSQERSQNICNMLTAEGSTPDPMMTASTVGVNAVYLITNLSFENLSLKLKI